MKKSVAAAGLAVLLASSGVTSAALADGNEEVLEEQEQEEQAQQDEENQDGEEEVVPEEEPLESLTLELAIEFALNENTSLLLLEDRLAHLKSQLGGSENDYEDILDDIEDLEDEMDDLRDVQKETGQRTFQSRLQLQNQIEALEDQLEPLEDSFRQMNSNIASMEYDKERAAEGIKLSTTSTYMQLLSTRDQIDFLKDSLETERKRVKNVETRFDIGVASWEELDQAQREVTRLQSQIDQLETQLEGNLSVFALNIGVVYDPEITLEAPDTDSLPKITQETPTEELIENSYGMKQAKEALALAKADRDDIYEDEDANSHDREQADLNVQVEERNIAQLREDMRRTIQDTFNQATTQYQVVQEAKREVSLAEYDYDRLKIQVDIGVLPRAEYELAAAQIDQARHDYDTEKQNYYLIVQQIESIRNGLIQQSQ
ncbi:TolC family protein [Alteribacillus iranensis]|uniref:Outer membrane efflux protein n=1 Tax=Alteribacillus iranensis TaxID=930128 RepID=A0A1I2BUX1_9BACI|nr:TolC family protein [Alteribacillus iranensis]SFE59909.1 Outer membrane efflux protein [Alteribacillus iranensis]